METIFAEALDVWPVITSDVLNILSLLVVVILTVLWLFISNNVSLYCCVVVQSCIFVKFGTSVSIVKLFIDKVLELSTSSLIVISLLVYEFGLKVANTIVFVPILTSLLLMKAKSELVIIPFSLL